MPETPLPAGFPTTRWSCVTRAGDGGSPEAQAALAALCQAYWFPIYALIRRRGHDPDQALDLAQEYFARLLEKGVVASADPLRGRFRSFLCADCVHFLANRGDYERAQKRGGGREIVSIDRHDAESRYHAEPAHHETPERLFERDWALALLDQVLEALESHYAKTGRGALFARLKPVLTATPDADSYAAIARTEGIGEGAVQGAVHRLRNRFRQLLHERVGATLDNPGPGDVNDEIRSLFEVLGS
jgi:DNA-directed RNA polymerase specialized sigma24 family protein